MAKQSYRIVERITGILDEAELRVQESDRIAIMASQLNWMGMRVIELPNGLEITERLFGQ